MSGRFRWRIGPSDGAEVLQAYNERLLRQLIDPDVIHRMAQAAHYPGVNESYQGIDLIKDLNNGLFAELKQPHPVIGLYRRDLQRKYVKILLSQLGAEDDSAGEMQAAIRAGLNDLAARLNQASSLREQEHPGRGGRGQTQQRENGSYVKKK